MLLSLAGAAQDTTEFTSKPGRAGRYSLVAYFNAGGSYYSANRGAPAYLQPSLRRVNPLATVRVLWHPDRQLKAGLESGFMTFYSYGLKDSLGKKGRVSLDAVPVLLVWSMSVTDHLNIFAGSGAYFLTTHLDYEGKSKASRLAMGWMAAASYIWPLGKNAGLGTEFKWMYASGTSSGVLALQVQYVWKFAHW
ncbi:hypothetical protein GCM10023184_10580 [Flaviaesturariibacter amylovorans]|uniref:Outer membrane protein beta-barrel domain-containing protein n=1 Tax=Flaviaesturariibacter amylovorans TaxID=1084520 RepID=A0ABP8GFZ4_9BACT